GSLVAVAASSSVIKTGWVNNATNATGIELYRSYDGNSDYVLLAELSPNTKSYNDTALYPGSLFYYKVRAVGDGGNSEYSNEASARTRGAVPTVLPIENVYVRFSSTVVLPIETTSASPTVISLQVSNLPGFAEFQQTENGRGTITFTPSEADQGVYNNIIVTATNPQNDINTAKFNVTVNANYVPVLNSVSNISVNETQTAQINLSVTDQDANDYLSWTFAGLPGFAIASPANRNASIAIAPKYGDAGVYTVKATVNDGRNGKDTTTFKITVVHAEVTNPNDGTAPIKPGNVTAQFVGNDAVKVSWTNMAYNAAGFEIFRSTSLTGYYTILNPGATNKDSTTYYDYTATGNNTYFYVVRAINANGGNNSAIVKIITPNTAPIINVNDIYIKSGNTNNVSIIATDDPGDIITLAASNLPSFVTFTDNGNGNGTIHLAPTGAYIGTYEISVKASDQYGAAAVKTIKIIVTNRYITSVFVNFNNKDYPVSYSSWNSFNAAQVEGTQVAKKTKISNLKEETGSITTLAVELPDSWPQHYGGVVTGNNSGIYPDSILMSGYYFFTKATVPQKTIRISGLDSGNNGKRYNLVFFGSRSYTSAQITYFTVGGQTVSLDATGNSTNTVQINNLLSSPEGVIDVIVNADMDKYAVINAMVIEEYDEAVFLPPFNLNMTKSTRSSISLSWKSNATDVTAFEVWRSDAPTGTYVKLPGTIPGNVFTYTDDGLTAGAVYYYKVRAVSGSEFSDFSDYISAATIKYEVNINLNDGIGPQPLPWNNTDLMYNGYTLTNLVNDNSLPTGINFTVIENFSGFNNWGMITGNNSGVVPDNVMKEFYYSL
ncbi:MAG TPA: fibronectin type III domain-containing protein, partial [Agriterribacter sp.]|nr:fibronectin type III domain-containing protein [Agriterribacter sp.]